MDSIEYAVFRPAVCDENTCWQSRAMKESGVVADVGDGWRYFKVERHFKQVRCVGRSGTVAKICDGLAVPLQPSQKKLIFLELKTSGQFADAVEQIRAGVRQILAYGIPRDVALMAEIWHRREPKTPITVHRVIDVDGRQVFVRHRRSK